MGKGEIACYMQFLLFSQCFPQLISLVCQNMVLCGNGLLVIHIRQRHFYAPASKDWGRIVLPMSICPSVCLHKLNMKT